MKLQNIQQIASWRLCVGCGVCAYACPENNITLLDVGSDGIRPLVDPNGCELCGECLKVCPGYETIHPSFDDVPELISELKKGWGPVLEMWEGYAADPEIRYNGSSGGLASALALYCLENEEAHGVLHTGTDQEKPWKNKTVFSRNRADILSRTGSRYSPASPCDGLSKIESAPKPCFFIGKPCDVAALCKAQELRPKLHDNTLLALGIFCAGTPSTKGTLSLIRALGVEPDEVAELRYRGRGWPGMATVRLKSEKEPLHKMTYMDSWGNLQKYRPFRCYLCPDGTSEFADISCGDPWYREIKEDTPGYSLAVVRTKRGRDILHKAIEAGYIHMERVDPSILEASQHNLLNKRRQIWGRLFAMRLFLIPIPRLSGFSLFQNWCRLSLWEKTKSVLGTIRRIVTRKYFRPLKPIK